MGGGGGGTFRVVNRPKITVLALGGLSNGRGLFCL